MKKQQARSAKTGRESRGGKITVFAQSLRREWQRLNLPTSNASVVVAVSGGADSTALLLALDELTKSKKLNLRIIVAHLNHGLRDGAGKADARWVTQLAKMLGYETVTISVDVKKRAASTGDNLEQAARVARYRFLERAAKKFGAMLVLTAHTMDDQAETILLNLLRGSGPDGLAGIEPVRALHEKSRALLTRPMLSWARRVDTENYCRLRKIDFRVDEMNADPRFARVRVRRQLLPLMESFNPKVVEGLARTAEILREEGAALDGAAARLLELATENEIRTAGGKRFPQRLRVDLLAGAQPALRRRALRQWIGRCRGDLRRVERVHVLAIESLLFGNRGGRVIELPGGARISRKRGLLQFDAS